MLHCEKNLWTSSKFKPKIVTPTSSKQSVKKNFYSQLRNLKVLYFHLLELVPAKPASAGVAGFKLVVCVSKNCNRPTVRKKHTPPIYGRSFQETAQFCAFKTLFLRWIAIHRPFNQFFGKSLCFRHYTQTGCKNLLLSDLSSSKNLLFRIQMFNECRVCGSAALKS